jgi:N-hydroxyarylamine O-acetyltransferase
MTDLAAYCARIGYAGPRAPTLAVLRDIVAGHAGAIPFENVDVLLGRGVRLDAPALHGKLLRQRRGGYCFEQNSLLQAVLRASGFRVAGLAARVEWGRPPGNVGPRTHMLLRVELPEGPHLADVGFGGLTPTAPLRLEANREQATPHETFRLVSAASELMLQAKLAGVWSDLYRFSPAEQEPIDYEVANWFTATHPGSLFTNHLIATMPAPGCRYTLYDDKFAIRSLDGRAERRRLTGAADLGEVIAGRFGLALPQADIAALAERIAGRTEGADPFEGSAAR